MSDAINAAFQALLASLAPKPTETAARRSHAVSIEQALRQEFPNFNALDEFGSHTKGTAIAGWSDIDYLAKLGRKDIRWGEGIVRSTTTLGRMRDALQRRFSQTEVWLDGAAVVVAFDQGRNAVDVTPGVYDGTTPIDGYPMFLIPDGAADWQHTSPQRHGKYIREEDESAGHKLAGTVRLLKAWKYARASKVPFLGFHVELLLASEGTCRGVKSYAECVRDALRLLRDRAGRSLNDPVGISPRIPIVESQAQLAQLVDAARYGAEQATLATQADDSGYVVEAHRRWNAVFNQRFPAR